MVETRNEAASKLKTMGILVLQLFGCENETTLRELNEAVRNAEQLDERAITAQALEKAAWNTLPNSREWQAFFSAQRRYLCCMRRHQKNSRRFGWSPLARRLLLEQYCKRLKSDGDSEYDPMEELLKEYGVPIHSARDDGPRQWDDQDRRMEELLNGKW